MGTFGLNVIASDKDFIMAEVQVFHSRQRTEALPF